MTLRATFTSALAGPLVNARATSAGVAPCAPTAGGCVAPITAPTEESPCSPTRSAPHSATSSATWCHTCRPSERTRSCTSALPEFEVLITQNRPAPSRRQAARKGSIESRPRYGLTVTASASGSRPFVRSRNAVAYARAVEPMSPRFASAITWRPAARAYAHTSSSARTPSAPNASKNATCGFTPTTYGATASTSPRQKRAQASADSARPRCASPFSSTGRRSGRGSSPTTSCERLCSTASASRSAKCVVATVATFLRLKTCKDGVGAETKCRGTSSAGLTEGGQSPPSFSNGAASGAVETARAARCAALTSRAEVPLAALDGCLELAPCRELRHRGGRDRHLLRRIPRIHALPLGAMLGGELAEPGECDLAAAPQCLGD